MKNLSIEDPGKFPHMILKLTVTNKKVADLKYMEGYIAPFKIDF